MSLLSEDLDAAPLSSPPALFEVGAVASMAGLRDSCGHVPLDACVPTLLRAMDGDNLTPNATRVLQQVDGMMSLGAIAEASSITLADAIEGFLLLLRIGVVGVREDGALAAA